MKTTKGCLRRQLQRGHAITRKLISRGFLGLLSQALNTGSNLGIALFLASQVSSESFGAWSVGYASFLITLAVARAVATTPMILGSTGIPPEAQVKGSLSLSIVVGLLAALLLAVGGAFGGSQIQDALSAFAIVAPVLCLQDAMRYNFIRRFAPGKAALLDAIRLAIQIGVFAYLLQTEIVTSYTATVGWGLSAFASCVVGFCLHGVLPSFSAGIEFIKANRWASGRLFMDALVKGLSGNALPYFLTAFIGLSAAGAFRAGQTLMGGVGLFTQGIAPIVVTEAIRKVRNGNPGWTILWIWTALLTIFSGLYGVAILVIPDNMGQALLGESWHNASPILLPLVLQTVLRGPITGVPIILRAGYLLDTALKLRIVLAVPNLVIPAIGAAVWGLQGAAWGLVLAAIIGCVFSIATVQHTRGRPPENTSKSFDEIAG